MWATATVIFATISAIDMGNSCNWFAARRYWVSEGLGMVWHLLLVEEIILEFDESRRLAKYINFKITWFFKFFTKLLLLSDVLQYGTIAHNWLFNLGKWISEKITCKENEGQEPLFNTNCSNFLTKSSIHKGLKLLYHFPTKYSVIEKSETSCAQNSNFFQSLVNQNRLNKVRFSFKIANTLNFKYKGLT